RHLRVAQVGADRDDDVDRARRDLVEPVTRLIGLVLLRTLELPGREVARAVLLLLRAARAVRHPVRHPVRHCGGDPGALHVRLVVLLVEELVVVVLLRVEATLGLLVTALLERRSALPRLLVLRLLLAVWLLLVRLLLEARALVPRLLERVIELLRRLVGARVRGVVSGVLPLVEARELVEALERLVLLDGLEDRLRPELVLGLFTLDRLRRQVPRGRRGLDRLRGDELGYGQRLWRLGGATDRDHIEGGGAPGRLGGLGAVRLRGRGVEPVPLAGRLPGGGREVPLLRVREVGAGGIKAGGINAGEIGARDLDARVPGTRVLARVLVALRTEALGLVRGGRAEVMDPEGLD